MVDVAPSGAILEVRARAVHTRRLPAHSAPSLTPACEMFRRSLYAEARATSLLGSSRCARTKCTSPTPSGRCRHRWAHSTLIAGPHTFTAACTRASPSPAEVYDALRVASPPPRCTSFSVLRSRVLLGRLGSASASASTGPRSSRSPATRVRSVPPFHGVLALREWHPLH